MARENSKKKFRRSSKVTHELDYIREVIAVSDCRVSVLVVFAAIDDLLGAHIGLLSMHRFQGKAGDWPAIVDEFMHSGDCPLGSASARIKCCYLFGLIDESLFKTLNKLREFRNAAAHFSGRYGVDADMIQGLKSAVSCTDPNAIEAGDKLASAEGAVLAELESSEERWLRMVLLSTYFFLLGLLEARTRKAEPELKSFSSVFQFIREQCNGSEPDPSTMVDAD